MHLPSHQRPVTCCLPTMPVRYTALPNPGSTPDTTCEMEEAFASDEEHDGHGASESTPLTHGVDPGPAESSLSGDQSTAIPTYDFERSYDFPPPGSPPGPSSRALPNDFGNSNGLLPTSPIVRPQPKPSLFRRIMGAVVPSQYMPLATDPNTRPTGGGLENDGVFANVVAKPQPARTVLSDNGDIHIVPEETQKDAPPVSFILIISWLRSIDALIVLSGRPSRCRPSLLGDNHTCTRSRSWRGFHHRRPTRRLLHSILLKHLHLLFLPICRFPSYLPPPHYTCGKIRVSCRPWSHTYSIWALFANPGRREPG